MFGFLANLFTSSVISQVVPAAAPALKMLDIFEGAKFVSDAVTGKSFGESPHNPDPDIRTPDVYDYKARS